MKLANSSKAEIRSLISKYFNFFISIYYKLFFLKIKFFNKKITLVLTMGKVGSSTIYHSLKKQIKNPIFHIHYFNEDSIKKSISEHLSSERKSIPQHLYVSSEVRKLKNKEISIIVLVREPISRKLSSVFQNSIMHKSRFMTDSNNYNLHKIEEFLNDVINSKSFVNHEKNWFDKEIKECFNIDIFKKKYDLNKDYVIFKKTRVSLLLMRTETMNKVFPAAMKQFLIRNIKMKLSNNNIGADKNYANDYNQIKHNFKIQKDRIEEIVNSKFFQHFYSHIKEEVKNRWIKK
tara:strand:+ start:3749 stop:4618 length:870 start_codon:yes stop_codon:yes gene_type:complete